MCLGGRKIGMNNAKGIVVFNCNYNYEAKRDEYRVVFAYLLGWTDVVPCEIDVDRNKVYLDFCDMASDIAQRGEELGYTFVTGDSIKVYSLFFIESQYQDAKVYKKLLTEYGPLDWG
jgi:hypothetical protein